MRIAVVIEMDYIGKELSVNHYKWGRYTKTETKNWMEELGWKLRPYHIEDWKLPLTVQCDGHFKDERRPDLHNLSKVILDAIEEATGINDKHMRWKDGYVLIGEEPKLIITIFEGGE